MTTTLDRIRESAKDLNSTDQAKRARAQEIKRRYEQGLFNAELTKEGAQPVPLKKPAIDMTKIMAQQEEGLVSKVPEEKGVLGNIKEKGTERMSSILSELGKKDVYPGQDIVHTAGQTAGFVGDIAGEALSPLFEKIMSSPILKDLGQQELVKQGMELAQKGGDEYKKFAEANPTVDQFLRDTTNILTVGIGGGVAKPLVKKTGEVLKEGGEKAISAAKTITPDTTGMAQSIVASINKVDPTAAKKFYASQGKEIGEWLTERGIIGDRETTVKTLLENFNTIKNNVDEALEKMPGTYKDKRVSDVAQESLQYAEAVRDPQVGRIKELSQKAEGIGLTPAEINEVKRYFERHIKMSHLQDVTKSSEVRMRSTNMDNDVRELLFEIADKNGFTNLRELNKEIQASKQLADAIGGKMVGQEANNMMGLTDWFVLGGGVLDPKFLAGFALKKGLGSETAKATFAKALAGFPKRQPLPRADLDEIQRKASEFLKKQEEGKIEQEKNALLADALQKAGYTMSEGPNGFIMKNKLADVLEMPLTKEEMAMIRAGEARAEHEKIVQFILEQREKGLVVGKGFTMRPAQDEFIEF